MAKAKRYVCGGCGHKIEAWSDGNPYYIDETGRKKYAYHPNHEALSRCIGNDSPHLCLECGQEFMMDSRAVINSCPKCEGHELADTYELEGHGCPYCKAGVFIVDPNFFCIS